MSPPRQTPSPGDRVDHPSFDELADLDAGGLDEASTATVEAHLASGCRRCTEVLTGLSAVRADLADLPPERIPADVAARLDDALAAAAASAPSATVSPLVAARAPRLGNRRPTWLGRAAAAVLVLVAGGTAVGVLGPGSGTGGGPDSDRPAATVAAPEALEQVDPAAFITVTDSGRDYDAEQLAAAAPQLAGTLTATRETASAGPMPPGPANDGPVPPGQGGASAPLAREGDGLSAVPDPLSQLREPQRLADCLDTLGGASPAAPVALDYAAYQGVPALVVVRPDPSNADRLSVSVVGPACQAGAGDLRYVTTVPRR